jgi:conjugative transfer signal peptidase TraF
MKRRTTWAALGGMAAALACVPAFVPIRPALIWNATASTPVGLYRLRPANGLDVRELVAAMPPEPIAGFLAHGGFLPRGVPLLKHVAALAGQTVCRAGDTVTVDGAVMGKAHDLDSRGRPLPRWSGCHRLTRGEVFLMNPSVPDSLDGRYFGPIPASSIVGRAIAVWLPHEAGVPAARAGAALPSPRNQQPKGTSHGANR